MARKARPRLLSVLLSAALMVPVMEVNAVAEETKTVSPELRERCLEILRKGLASEEFWPAMHAAEALTQVGLGKEVQAALVPKLASETDDRRRCGLAREIARAGDRSKATILLEILAKPDLKNRIQAAESMYKVEEIGDGELLRKAMAQTDSVSLQLMAAGALARKGDKSALAQLRKTLVGTDPDGPYLAAFLLGRLGDRTDIAPLQRYAEGEKDPLKKSFALFAAAVLGSPEGKEYVARALASDNADVRTYAAEAAGAAGMTNVAPGLTKLLDDAGLDIRIRAAQALLLLPK